MTRRRSRRSQKGEGSGEVLGELKAKSVPSWRKTT